MNRKLRADVLSRASLYLSMRENGVTGEDRIDAINTDDSVINESWRNLYGVLEKYDG